MKKKKDIQLSDKIIFLTGVDGSGKTFLAQHLIRVLREHGIQAVHVWSRFNNFFSKPLLAFTRLIGLNYYEHRDGIRIGYHDFEKSRLISSLFILLQLLDVWVASILKFWIPIAKGHPLIVSDRGPYDTIMDVAVDTGMHNFPSSFLAQLYSKSIPFPHKIFLIQRDKNKIEQSRSDIKYDRKFKKRSELYFANAKIFSFHTISNNDLPNQAILQIMRAIFNEEEETTSLDN